MIKATYFRLMYQGEGKCSVHRVDLSDTKTGKRFRAVYLSGEKPVVESDEETSLFSCAKKIDLLVIGDFSPAVVQKATEILREKDVARVVIPACTEKERGEISAKWNTTGEVSKFLKEPSAYCGECSAETVLAVSGLDELKACGWSFRFKRVGTGETAALAVFHGPDGQKEVYEDCVMTVKPSKGKPCAEQESLEESGCSMACSLYRDFDVCKRQNARDREEYTLGTLLLGDWKVWAHEQSLEKVVDELTASVPESVRFITCRRSVGSEKGAWRLANLPVRESEKRYFIMPDEPGITDELGDICRASLYFIPAVVADGNGLCCTGFLKYNEQ